MLKSNALNNIGYQKGPHELFELYKSFVAENTLALSITYSQIIKQATLTSVCER